MITLEQAKQLCYRQEIHYTGRQECKQTTGPRGGVVLTVVRCRVSGRCRTWKTRPGEFRVPVKYGLYESGEINHRNAGDWHLAKDCPCLKPA